MNPNLKLTTNDWRWATWRDIPPEKLPAQEPFDFDAALKKIGKAKRYISPDHDFKLNPNMTREEAHFWLEAILYFAQSWRNFAEDAVQYLGGGQSAEAKYHGGLTLADVHNLVNNQKRHYFPNTPSTVLILHVLLDRDGFLRGLSEFKSHHYGASPHPFTLGFRKYILPYLTPEDRDAYRDAMQPYLGNWRLRESLSPIATTLGGLDTEIEAWLNMPKLSDQLASEIVFGLSNPTKMEEWVRQLNITFWDDNYMKAWIAHTETNALDHISTIVKDRSTKADAQKAFRFFNKVPVPESVPPVLDLWQASKVQGEALQWLLERPEIVVGTMVPLALGTGKYAKLAQKYIQRMIGSNQLEHIEALAPSLSEDDQARLNDMLTSYQESDLPLLDDETTPDWLKQETVMLVGGKKKPSKKITWVNLLELPALTIDGKQLNDDHLRAVLTRLSTETKRHPEGLLAQLREHITSAERDAFVIALFDMWMDNGAPSKNGWALKSMGLLGDDGVVFKLTPLIRTWPGMSQHTKAVSGLNALRDIGTDTALMSINGVAQKVKYQGIKKRAREAMDAIAKEMNLTKAALEDRIIPDCNLDENGQRTFDYGARQFTFVLSSDMKPMVRDEAKNKLRASLPKPNKKDDEILATQAQADWKLLKKQIREVAKVQAKRLEDAMTAQRRWTLADFQQFYIGHPLMIHIIRLLLWGGYDAEGELVGAFRISEDREFVDLDDEPITTESMASIGVLHAMELEESDQQEWGEVLSDYEIIPPFPQLGRRIGYLEPDEVDQKEITRFAEQKVEPVIMVNILEKSGWVRGAAQDGGVYFSHAKFYETANVTAIVRYEGIPMGYWDWDAQGIDSCFFVEGEKRPEGYREYKDEQMLRLGDVSPVVMSETLRTLHAIASKAGDQ